ncbi:hypothetical protein BY996DRAFT_6436076 [Phakopsora pachyrhizi]|uniref:DUF7872 domain-containing protein n=1 Tax=Phakopsora pachyrhizi TaxID=170000 RepID=A0AAV0BCM3_PHAPC|nr:hypothetical protein BY996DRAFT_6436076 [Phakopsora pachyrhizi]CAH7684111.1 hypothetical protein PPACK8108_LOCUS18113 [Phakopsora pachyrhizi]
MNGILSSLGLCCLLVMNVSASLNLAAIKNNQHSTQTVFTPCSLPSKLSSKLWDELKIDDFIKNYPNGKNLTVKDFARENKADNFLCGIGEKCNAGELCYPVQGLAWYVLFATQEYNLFMNSVYKAVGTSMDLVRGKTKPPPSHKLKGQFLKALTIISVIGLTLTMAIMIVFPALPAGSAWVTVATFSGWATVYSEIGIAGLMFDSLIAKETRRNLAFESWSEFAYYFSECESHMHETISSALKNTLNSGISQTGPGSLATVLSHGSFVEPRMRKSLPELEAKIKDITRIRALIVLLRSMNAFVTRGSEPCTGPGINGARDENNHLSFCGPENVMMNIVFAEGDKVKDDLYNARSLSIKYSITTEYLTMVSWDCQRKHGMSFDPYQNNSIPTSTSAECLANLPVCDCTVDDIMTEIKRSNIVKACRDVGKLPI